ncbi:competence protein ComEC [Fodinibius salinus]|uniref:Competence protein ComEC n=1 Tax=Fodinibius salinus TaxID=860790 RepID=A0A5D3YNW7_9BACT|nr:DNA internalization-related competence protein ComEC/Rec2 [Fodinibius salinus]TYP93849.1 competence protein ComEC [Fodinibius salinus]
MEIKQSYQFPFASYPAVRLLLLMAAGILLDYHLQVSSYIWLGLFATSASIYLLSEYFYQEFLKAGLYNTAICCYLILIIAFGASWHSFFDYRTPPEEAQILNAYTWKELTFSGTVHQIRQTNTGKYQIDTNVDTTLYPNDILWDKSYRIRTILDPADIPFPNGLELGDQINFSAIIYPLDPKRNPGQFDYKDYLSSIGIYTQAGITNIGNIHSSPASVFRWTSLRQKVLDAIEHNFSKQTVPLAKALLIGHKNELKREEKIAFSRAGLSHIMAVSGLHVGFILAPFWICIPLFWTFRYGKEIGLFLLLMLLFFYAGLTGFSASVMRASLVGGFLAYGKLFNKVRNSKNLTAVAALILLLINPGNLFTIGFQLSFSAVYVILLTAPIISRKLPAWIQYRWYGQPVMVVIISFIVQLGLFPLLAYHFGEFSIIGPFANAIVVPILGIAVPVGLLLLPLSSFLPDLAHTLNIPIDYFLGLLDWFVTLTANWPWSWMQVHIRSLLFFSIWTAIIFLIASLPIPKMRWKWLAIVLALLCVDQAQNIIQKIQPAKLHITFFDVGQGDAALVKTPAGKHFLIDTGRWQPDYNSGKYIIIPYLKQKGIEKLDGIFLSHPHADHIGGMPELIDNIAIDTIYNSGAKYDSQLYDTYRRKATEKTIPIVPLTAGQQVVLDPSMRIFIYGPAQNISDANVNNRSLILELIYGQTQMLFMGDAEHQQEQRIARHYPQLIATDFLKVGHHGSKTSSSTPLLQQADAKAGIISLSKQNQFHHPHPAAIQRLQQDSVSLYFTSLTGAIQLWSDGSRIRIEK